MSPRTPAFDPHAAQQMHQALVVNLTHDGLLADPAIAAAFRDTPRHLFLPNHSLEEIYADKAIAVKREGDEWISSSSQPAMMAIMLAQLGLEPGQRVLEIGTGTGYNAALIAHIVGPRGRVISVDIDAELIAVARAQLAAAGRTEVELRCADGALGAPDMAPFDRIIVTVGAWDLLPAWREQLAPGGRIVVPLTILPGLMLSLGIEQRAGRWEAVSARPCGFLLMRGAEAHPPHTWGTPRIVLHPRTARHEGMQVVATVEKTWNRFDIFWDAEEALAAS